MVNEMRVREWKGSWTCSEWRAGDGWGSIGLGVGVHMPIRRAARLAHEANKHFGAVREWRHRACELGPAEPCHVEQDQSPLLPC